jgi:hypothetical protein
MKLKCLVGFALMVFLVGCKQSAATRPGPSESSRFSDGGYTWELGAITIDGTNVPMSIVRVRALTNASTR